MSFLNPFAGTENDYKMRYKTYLLNVLFAFQVTIPLYINSNFLTTLVSEGMTSLTYAVAAALSIASIAATSQLLTYWNNYQTTLTLLIADAVALCVLAANAAVSVLLFAFIVHWILTAVIRYHLDIFLESYSRTEETDQIRGTLSALRHIAFILGPLIAGWALGEDAYSTMYLIAAAFSVPTIYVLMTNYRNFRDPEYHYQNLWHSIKTAWKDTNVRWALVCMFLLRLFYAWMVVYTPIYLHQYIGLPFDKIGIILSIMLLPFVLFGRWLGEIADHWLGEKELLIAGFVIIAAFTASLSFVATSRVIVWGLLLFGTRVGATLVQVMSSGYFFKHINAGQTNELSLARSVKPIAYIAGPVLATVMLAVSPFSYIFLWIAGISLFGALAAFPIVDTR
jgi:predicted MFS family arabinose efflux permease